MTIGAGIFVLPATVTAGLGSAAPLAYTFSIFVAASIWFLRPDYLKRGERT